MRYPSNIATPRYYKEFRKSVIRGEIPINEHIAQEMNRIDALIANPDVYYHPGPVEGWVNFCEAEMTKTDGTEIKLLDSFKLWGEQLFGWYYYAKKNVYVPRTKTREGYFHEVEYLKRLISKQYLIVARGAAKTMYEAFLQAYFLVMDGSTTHQITTAPTMRQAEEVLSPIRTALIRSPGPVLNFMTAKLGLRAVFTNNNQTMLASTKKGIENFLTGSLLEIRPMTITKLQGLRPKISTVDEWLSGDIREDVVGAIEQGASKLNDYLIVAVSSEGTVRNGSGDEIKHELLKILKGEYNDIHTSIFYYRLDNVKEVAHPDLWKKANPNLGLTVSYEAYERDVKRAANAPSTANDILAKRFGLPMEGYTYFFTYAETIPHPKQSYYGMQCAMGADMSQGDDFCSFTFLFPMRDGSFGIKSINFISERTFRLLSPSIREKYEQFIAEDALIVLNGTVLDMEEVYDIIEEEIERRKWDVLPFGYDPYNADVFVRKWTEYNGEWGVLAVRQGSRTESVPLGELKKFAEDRLLLFDEAIFSWAMGNTMVLEDTNGNIKLYKRRYENKIDPVSALMDAYVAYKANAEMFK